MSVREIRTATLAGGGTVETAIFVPDAYRGDTTTPRPAVLFLHGWGGATAVPDAMGLAMDDGLLERIVTQPGLYDGARRRRGHLYVTGLSTGGQGVFTIASAFPSRFAAAAPIGSTYDERTPVCSMLDVPVWAFHGEFDTLQPPGNTTMYLDRLRTGCPMAPTTSPVSTLVSCRDAPSDHCGWIEAYDGTHGSSASGFTSIWSWLLSHTR